MTTSKFKISNKVLSVLLCAAMLLSYLPLSSLTAFAAATHSHPICSAAHTDIGNHTGECGNVTWSAWSTADALPSEAGSYYLTTDVTLSSTWAPTNAIQLCLNGHDIQLGSGIYLELMNAPTLTLTDCSNTTRYGYWAESGYTIVDSTDKIPADTAYNTLVGGCVTNGANGIGGALHIYEGTTFNLYGGNICGNKATSAYGGGIWVQNTATVNQYGGSLSGNIAQTQGGAAYIDSSSANSSAGNPSVYNLYGGTISGNTAQSGGGVYVVRSTFNIYEGSAITGNSSTISSSQGGGGGIANGGKSSITMYGGTISNNTAALDGGAVYLSGTNAAFTMKGGTISGNSAGNNGGAVNINNSTSASFTLGGGTITGNFANKYGGAINYSNGKLYMNGGTISNNYSEKGFGGGVSTNNANGTFTMTDGTISGNYTKNTYAPGGGVYIGSSTFNMSGGKITGNHTDGKYGSYSGAGVYTSGKTTISGGEITGNYSVGNLPGAGIYINGGTTTFSGNPVITGNKTNGQNGKVNNVYLPNGKVFAIDSANGLTDGASIGITTQTAPTADAPVAISGTNNKNYLGYFSSDNTAYEVINSDNSTLQLAIPVKYVASVTDKDGSTTKYKTFPEAMTAAKASKGSTLTLLDAVTADGQQDINNCKFTLDMNGKTLTVTNTGDDVTFLNIGAGGELTIKDSGTNGKISVPGSFDFSIRNTGTLTIESGTIEGKTIRNETGATLYVKGGTIIGIGGPTIWNAGTAYMSGGKIKNEKNNAVISSGILYFSGSEAYSKYGISIVGSGSAYFSGGSAESTVGDTLTMGSPGTLEIKGGIFKTATGKLTISDENGTIQIKGGEFPNGIVVACRTVNALLADGYAYYDANGNLLHPADTDTSISGAVKVGIGKTDETIFGKKDGAITGVNSTMEYRKESDSTYTAISGDKISNLAAGKYYVRIKGDSNHNPSPDTEVTIAAGRKLTVTIPTASEQIGYTLTVDKNELDWHGQVTITFELADGYSKSTTDFAVKVNGTAITLDENGKHIVTNAETDITITVAGVVDETAPETEISISTNKWRKFLNGITFGLFFKETQDITITATDMGSGVDNIYYYIFEDVLTEDEVKALAADKWILYDADNKPSINPDKKCIVYAKATDKAGNVKFITSNGLVFDGTAPQLFGIENGDVYYGDKIFKATDDNFLKIEVDGIDITDTTEGDDEYKIVADNAEHTITVTDKAGNVTECKITVYKKYSVTFVAEGEAGSYEKEFKYQEVITIPTNEIFEATFRKSGYTLTGWQGYTEGMTMPLNNLTFTAIYTPNRYTVEFDTNGGAAIDPITVTYAEKYGRLPSSAITGLSGGDSNWYLVDQNGTVTDTKITKLSKVLQTRNHKLFVKRKVLAPTVSITLTVPGGLSDSYSYYIPDNSQRVLTATVGNKNTELLDYTYRWYKNGSLIDGANSNVLTLEGNVADSGTYKVEVTATLKNNSGIVVTSASATAQKEKQVKILHAANTLSYDANGGTGGPSSSYTGSSQLNVSGDEPTKEHHIFNGWNTKADGSGDSYKGGDTYTFADDNGNGGCKTILYAQWKPVEHTVTFTDENGVYKTVTVKHGEKLTMPEPPTKDGYTVRWEKEVDTVTADMTVKAVYTKLPVADSKPTSPQTDENINLSLWIALLFISGGTISATAFTVKKRKIKA